jgi:hypothetical protein
MLVLLVSFVDNSFAQSLNGTVIDEEKNPMEFVSVALLQPEDSLLVKYTSTGIDGKFELSGFKEGTYMLQIYFMTYQADQRMLTFSKEAMDVGSVELKKEVNQLDEVIITAVIPIIIKQDTMAFNTKAFKVRQDDNVEDLIKKLPGIEIATDGAVSAQGQEVTKILVDGKEFFNNDMSIALKNLTADAVKSVQIIDEESDDTRTTGIKDGEKNKIINLVLKEGKKSGYFGKMGLGIGTEERYTSNFDINRFTKNTQTAVFGKLNNINNTGATVFQRDGSRSNNSGYLTTGTSGANFNYEFKKDLNFNVDYYYSYSDRDLEESSNRTEFTNDKSFTSSRDNRSENISNNHNINFSLRDRSTKGVYMAFRGEFKKDDRESTTNNSTVFFNENEVENTNSERSIASEDKRNNGELSLYYSKKLNEIGRNFRIRSGLDFRDNDDINFQQSLNKFNVSDPTNYSESNEITKRDENNKAVNYNFSIRYMEPIVPHHFVSVSTGIRNGNDDDKLAQTKTVNDIALTPLIYDIDYKNRTYNQRLGYVYSKDKFQLYASGAYHTMHQKMDLDRAMVIDNKYNNILPEISMNYEYKKGSNVRLKYEKETSLPSANQASPVVNDFNPLYISQGNANLTPEESYEYSLRAYSHDFKSAGSFFTYFNYTKTSNAIVTNRTIDDNYVQYSTYQNYGSKSTVRGVIHFSKKINSIGLRYTTRISANTSDYFTIIDDALNNTKSRGAGFGLSLGNDNKNNADLVVGANYNFNKTTYSLQNRDRDYFRQNYYSKFDWDITDGLNFNTQFDYSLYTDNNFDSQTVPIWNLAIQHSFFSGKRGNLKLQIFDILDKDLGIERTSSANYYEETFSTNLGTYAMLSFTYNIKPPTGRSSKRGEDNHRRRYRRY